MKVKLFLLVAIAAIGVAGCTSAPTKNSDTPDIAKAGVIEMSPAEARPAVAAAYSQFVDVRTPEEFAAGHADRARNIPLDELSTSLDKIEKNEPVYLICETGRRSQKAAEILRAAGFKQAISITGGTAAWKAAGLPMAQ